MIKKLLHLNKKPSDEFIQRILSETIENCGHSELDPTENDPNIEINYQYGECGLMFESGKKSLALIYIL
jgi:hypothetical protein